MQASDPRCPCGYPRSTCWRCAAPDADDHSGKLVRIVTERLTDETPLQAADRLGVIFLEPRSDYDKALVGIARRPNDRWPRTTDTPCAVYDTLKCLMVIMEKDGVEFDAAIDWFDYNVADAWMGEGTPTFVEIAL